MYDKCQIVEVLDRMPLPGRNYEGFYTPKEAGWAPQHLKEIRKVLEDHTRIYLVGQPGTVTQEKLVNVSRQNGKQ